MLLSLPYLLPGQPGRSGSSTVTFYTTMELNAWEIQQLNHFLQEGQGIAREVLRAKLPDDIVRDVGRTRREALVLRLYDLLLRLDKTRVSRGGRVCADRLWEIIFDLLATLCF
ncbi:hypothetical protein OsI_36210 [Oryza sativa Indica Group]|nr:hypothetical protein OsI_36210 [Oryza sativa Indica Group]EEE52150.1 hypothetical protein OsJ_33990 [Oryza sativa Japonica Group]